jgi:hypothetical protein
MAAPLERTSTSGVYVRGSRWVAVYLEDGRQRRRSAPTFRAAREIKIRADAEEAARRAGPTLHSYALEWVDHYAGRGAHDAINDRTRREYRRLLIAYALAYFAPEERLRDWIILAALAGGCSPQRPSVRASTLSVRLALSASIASTARCLIAPSTTGVESMTASTGPNTPI